MRMIVVLSTLRHFQRRHMQVPRMDMHGLCSSQSLMNRYFVGQKYWVHLRVTQNGSLPNGSSKMSDIIKLKNFSNCQLYVTTVLLSHPVQTSNTYIFAVQRFKIAWTHRLRIKTC